ncbi:MAG: formylglycine-generating enzyme family protein [Verrucomicrobiota bacterium]
MKKRVGLVLMGFVFCNAEMIVAQEDGSSAPSLQVACNVLAATIRIEGPLPSGDKSILVDGNPVELKKGEQYTLSVTKPGYNPYRKSFTAAWSGPKNKEVVLEKGIGSRGKKVVLKRGFGPIEGKSWIAELEDSVEMEFMPIPAGYFMMGSDEGEEDERPVHQVEFKRSFWMAKTEVTRQQYEQFGKVNYKLEKNEVEMPKGAEYPACYVSWNEAMAFCKWLTKKERRRGRLPEGYEYTLPTEAEWEYACRAGTTGNFAGKLDSMAWYKKTSVERTSPVGSKKPNAWGLHDMHGNVWEWCVDNWYSSYTNAPVNGSQRGDAYDEYDVDRSRIDEDGNTYRLYSPGHRVVRGGSWSYPASACRSANRYYHTPDYKLNYLGFRPVVLWNPPTPRLRATKRIAEGL